MTNAKATGNGHQMPDTMPYISVANPCDVHADAHDDHGDPLALPCSLVVHSHIHGRLRCHGDVAAELEVRLHDLDAIEHRRALRDFLLELRCAFLEKRLENRPAVRGFRGYP